MNYVYKRTTPFSGIHKYLDKKKTIVKGVGIMKKMIMACFIMVSLFSIALTTTVCAQEKKDAAPAKTVVPDVAADSDSYIIGPEDVIHIFVWREEHFTSTVPVRMDGKITLPLVDDIQAAGLTPLRLRDELVKKYKAFVENPTISVTVIEANSFKAYVSGEVKNPGVQRIRSTVTIVELMAMAGGFTEWANKKKILILRKEKGADKRITINYNRIVEGKDPNIIINRGDTIIVP